MTYAIHINEYTQKFIAKMFNDGVLPEIEGGSYYERSYYLVHEDLPNDIVSVADFQKNWRDVVDKIITRPPRKR